MPVSQASVAPSDLQAHSPSDDDSHAEITGGEPQTGLFPDAWDDVLNADSPLERSKGLLSTKQREKEFRVKPKKPAEFVGRKKELEECRRLLSAMQRAMAGVVVTIGGIGGVGKSWLTRSIVSEFQDFFPAGQVIYSDLLETQIEGYSINSLRDFKCYMANLVEDTTGIPFSNFRRLVETSSTNSTSKTQGQDGFARFISGAWVDDFLNSVKLLKGPLLLALDNFESVDYFRGIGDGGRRNFCQEWMVWLAKAIQNSPVALIITGRDIEHRPFHDCPTHQHFELRGLKAPEVLEMLRFAGAPSSARIAKHATATSQGHPQTIRYLIEYAVKNQFDESKFFAILDGGYWRRSPGDRASALTRILRYSWDEKFIADERKSSAKVERLTLAALAMLCSTSANAQQERVILQALQKICPTEIKKDVPDNPVLAIQHAFPSLFVDNILHPSVSELIIEALIQNQVAGVGTADLSKALLREVRASRVAHASIGSLLSDDWYSAEAIRLGLTAWHDRSKAENGTIRFVILTMFVVPSKQSELIALLAGQSGLRSTHIYEPFRSELCTERPISAGKLSKFFSKTKSDVTSVDSVALRDLAIETLSLRLNRGRPEVALQRVSQRSFAAMVDRVSGKDLVNTLLIQEIARHRIFARAQLSSQSNGLFEESLLEYQQITDNPGVLFPEKWTKRVAGEIIDIYVRQGKFDKASELLSKAGDRGSVDLLSEKKSKWRDAMLNRALEQIRQDQLGEALNNLILMESQIVGDEQVLSNILRVLRRLGRMREASELAVSLQQRNIQDVRSLLIIGEIELMTGNFDDARRRFEQVRAILEAEAHPNPKQYKLIASCINHLAEISMLGGDYSSSRVLFSKRIEIGCELAATRPNDGQKNREINVTKHAYTKRGFAEFLADDPSSASNSFSSALAIDDKYRHALLGMTLCHPQWERWAQAALTTVVEGEKVAGSGGAEDAEGETGGDALLRLDGIHLSLLLGRVCIADSEVSNSGATLSVRTISEIARRVGDIAKLLFLVKRLECTLVKWPSNRSIETMTHCIRAAAST